MVVDASAINDQKFHDQHNTFLAKLQIGEAMYYVQYTPVDDDKYYIHTAYFHRAKLQTGE